MIKIIPDTIKKLTAVILPGIVLLCTRIFLHVRSRSLPEAWSARKTSAGGCRKDRVASPQHEGKTAKTCPKRDVSKAAPHDSENDGPTTRAGNTKKVTSTHRMRRRLSTVAVNLGLSRSTTIQLTLVPSTNAFSNVTLLGVLLQ